MFTKHITNSQNSHKLKSLARTWFALFLNFSRSKLQTVNSAGWWAEAHYFFLHATRWEWVQSAIENNTVLRYWKRCKVHNAYLKRISRRYVHLRVEWKNVFAWRAFEANARLGGARARACAGRRRRTCAITRERTFRRIRFETTCQASQKDHRSSQRHRQNWPAVAEYCISACAELTATIGALNWCFSFIGMW